jgi:hypothetical protein
VLDSESTRSLLRNFPDVLEKGESTRKRLKFTFTWRGVDDCLRRVVSGFGSLENCSTLELVKESVAAS